MNWYSEKECSIDEFIQTISAPTPTSPKFHEDLVQQIPLYSGAQIRKKISDETIRKEIFQEWSHIFSEGCGIIVIKNGFLDLDIIDSATEVFNTIIIEERGQSSGDHFAQAGANERIWNALEKLCLTRPKIFVEYYSNLLIQAISMSWLGPAYQMTSQINTVLPGGSAQQPHRDYHLGFMSNQQAEQFPARTHLFSPYLTLQGAVAHTDMPIESGPTKLLPFSQRYSRGYLAYRQKEFKEYFGKNYTQIPLEKGDLLFFNPALFHAAGSNETSHIRRIANLLQVSSAFGKTMESVDRFTMSKTVFNFLHSSKKLNEFKLEKLEAVIASCADGYPFPTNLDRDPPLGGLAPQSQQDLLRQAIQEHWDPEKFDEAVNALMKKRH